MDELREQGIESLAIPHNSNGSNGAMFAVTDYQGNPIDTEYVAQRARNEPLVEITQIKGTSDTHPYSRPPTNGPTSRFSHCAHLLAYPAIQRVAMFAMLCSEVW